jgi:FKBP-type peptidyl-prolyl cis-trans isomerase (trigger factor)
MTSEPGAGPNTSAPATFLVRPLGTSHGLSRFWIEQPMEDLLEKENEVLNRLQRDVKWPGFRRGGVPIPKIRQRYAGDVREQALMALIKESVGRALRESNRVALTAPVVESCDVAHATVRIKFAVECPPDVDVTGYKGLTLKRKTVAVPEEAVEAALREIGGDTASAPVEFRNAVRKILEAEAERLIRRDLESQAAQALLEANPFDVPPSLAQERERALFRRLEAQFKSEGGADSDWKIRYDQYEPEVRAEAQRAVRLAYMLAAIAQEEGISVTPEEAAVAVRKVVKPLPEDHRERSLKRLEAQKEDVRGLLLEDKVFEFILKHAHIVPAETPGATA